MKTVPITLLAVGIALAAAGCDPRPATPPPQTAPPTVVTPPAPMPPASPASQ
jgi:hypothetical protein